jgi:hypothetical protein
MVSMFAFQCVNLWRLRPGSGALWEVPAEERGARRDFTGVRVASIDPPTAGGCTS